MKVSKWLSTLCIIVVLGAQALAHEGMWIPSVLGSVHDEMAGMGLKLSKEELYSLNKSSLKDAVVLFGGGCTGEMVSNEGLMFTNHHCGYDYIQFHSSLEHDYLTDGFWAKSRKEELACQGLTATFVVSMEDVTASMNEGVMFSMALAEIEKLRAENKKKIEAASKGTNLDAVVRAFNYGNQYFLIVSKTYRDVRLVGAPPSEIGKFGGDTDNWVWPRHTGDFSVFRIYADKNNNPADYSADNVPYTPGHFFPISLKGVKEGDFTMVYGFPGRTEHLLTSYAVDYVLNVSNPMRIKMRETSLSIIDARMKQSDKLRIQYAAKQSGISNAYKKWIGQEMGLKRYNASSVKGEEERAFQEKVAGNAELKPLLENIKKLYHDNQSTNLAREAFVEYVFYGPEVFAAAKSMDDFFKTYEASEKGGVLEQKRDELIAGLRLFYKDFDLETEKQLFASMTPLYLKAIDSRYGGAAFQKYTDKKGDYRAMAEKVYSKSVLRDSTLAIAFIKKYTPKAASKLSKDPAMDISSQLYAIYMTELNPKVRAFNGQLDALMSSYVRAKQEVLPVKNNWNDANSTLRISFGKVEGSAPRDGMAYTPFTTASGILEKYETKNPDFAIRSKLKDMISKKQFGKYAENGELHVCYTGSNHTTGGNSGSPALNADGHLIGINFDRSWESTMSDIYYSPEICRNIMVDARYVLWVIDEYAGAGYLLNEMKLVQ